jgi:hypothetical protein
MTSTVLVDGATCTMTQATTKQLHWSYTYSDVSGCNMSRARYVLLDTCAERHICVMCAVAVHKQRLHLFRQQHFACHRGGITYADNRVCA